MLRHGWLHQSRTYLRSNPPDGYTYQESITTQIPPDGYTYFELINTQTPPDRYTYPESINYQPLRMATINFKVLQVMQGFTLFVISGSTSVVLPVPDQRHAGLDPVTA